jgi:type II secretory pathway component PulF
MTTGNTTADPLPQRQTFVYAAQTFDGQAMNGTVDAVDLDDASRRLAAMRLRIVRLEPTPQPLTAKPLRGEDFAAFNQQLAHLAAAGMPIEHGLRLIAEDLQNGAMAQSIRDVAAELENGASLGEAFQRHQRQFPPLYGAIVEAGVRSGNLPAVLLNVGRHLDMVSRLRGTLWRASVYPLMVVAGLLIVLIFLSRYVIPQFILIFKDFGTDLPAITKMIFLLADAAPIFMTLGLILVIGFPAIAVLLRATGLDRAAADLLLPLPVVGTVLRRNLVARWCDGMKLAVQAAMDLPAAVQVACDVVGSPLVSRDGRHIIAHLSSGQTMDTLPQRLWVVPMPVLAIIQTSTDRNSLADSLDALAQMYEQQAEMRITGLQALLTPLLVLAVAVLVGLVILALFAPMIALLQSVSGS